MFRKNQFANPPALAGLIAQRNSSFKLQPDHKLVFRAEWEEADGRLIGVRTLVKQLAELAAQPPKAPPPLPQAQKPAGKR